jgi:ABC-type lipoprotein export system ATPase subunit/lysophospholipase L1-like esterase
MVNDGVPGEKARDSATMQRFAQSVSANRPDVVLLMHGYNDVEDPAVITDTVNAIDAMAAEARNRRVGRVFMINMAPGRPGSGARPPSTIQAFNERYERAARGENAVHVDIHSALLPGVNQYRRRRAASHRSRVPQDRRDGAGRDPRQPRAALMPADLLVADRLTRMFDARVAVRDLSLAVAGGEVVALLGPNGAGKTTTMRMLAGLILPTAGRITIDRVEVTSATADLARRAIGTLTEAPGLWERLSVRLNLLTYARSQGLDAPEREVDRALGEVDLADRADDTAGSLSKGLKQRVAIARALIHRPPIVLLDEPTSGCLI